MHDIALLVFHVEQKIGMGIGPHESCHNTRQGHGFSLVVIAGSMVSRRGYADHQKTRKQSEGLYQSNEGFSHSCLRTLEGDEFLALSWETMRAL
jgi:hypothetical protein